MRVILEPNLLIRRLTHRKVFECENYHEYPLDLQVILRYSFVK